MEPIAWPNAALARMFPEQNLLADQRHHDGVVHVVVGRIAIGNILQREAPNETYDVRIGGLEDSVDLAVLAFKLLNECLDDNLSWIEHDRLQCADAIPLRARRHGLLVLRTCPEPRRAPEAVSSPDFGVAP